MMMTEGLILGHYISAARIQVDPPMLQVTLLLATPGTQTEVHSFLGFVGYYHRFIKNFLQISSPLYALTGNVDFIWTDKCDTAFTNLKQLVSTAPVLRGPNWIYLSRFHQMQPLELFLAKKKTRNLTLYITSAKTLLLLS